MTLTNNERKDTTKVISSIENRENLLKVTTEKLLIKKDDNPVTLSI